MPPASLDGTRLFARIHAADFECPRCGRIVRIRQGRKTPGYNARTGAYTCPDCSVCVQLGVLLYPVAAARAARLATPDDWIPTIRQAAALRQLQTAIYLGEANRRPRNTTPANLRGPECTCQAVPLEEPGSGGSPVDTQARSWRLTRHPRCPIHVGPAGEAAAPPPGDPNNAGDLEQRRDLGKQQEGPPTGDRWIPSPRPRPALTPGDEQEAGLKQGPGKIE